MKLKDKVVIVTGASQGIGRYASRLLSQAGAKVVLAARSMDKLKKLQKELPGSFAVETDLRNKKDIKRLFTLTMRKFWRVDVLVNNAGQGMWSPVENLQLKQYQDMLELNLFAPLLCMQEAIPIMRKQNGGMIVNVSSMVTENHYPNLGGYASTKYALNCLSRTARAELHPDKIEVKVFRPKLAETDFGKNSVIAEPDMLRDRSNPHAPPMDTPQFVAEKLLELIQSEEVEMSL
jgi:short-subunit dehydrogenase